MRWPPWSSDDNSGRIRRFTERVRSGELFTAEVLLSPEVLFPTLVLTSGTLAVIYFYSHYVRRIPMTSEIYPSFFRRRSLFGTVMSVGDGDNFRLFHTPGGRLMGWGWMPGRKVPTVKKDLRDVTLHLRIAGIDAPECAHFGKTAQPGSSEALAWLRDYILNHRVRAYIYRRDQYDRVVASIKVRKGLFRRDVGLEMLKAGMATVYESRMGAEFGSLEKKYREAEAMARRQRIGIWALSKKQFISPGAYKKGLRERGL
ncbi:SNase-domain-containing protein [Tuber magnatum]|uniref:Probable endonuclease LCL3 n=1 Tax=Tuber magnatum TaxID=42249 RepID=A0A317SJ92_9PEZI|nr:SNase-domain-containing protein [Tuber magnatum]